MTPKCNSAILYIVVTVLYFNPAFSQNIDEESEKSINRKYAFYDYRGSNAVDLAGGLATLEENYSESELGLYLRIGYKHYIASHLNINFTFNKYNVAINDAYNEDFMSFDLNLELFFSPHTRFSPFIYAGGGYNASNYFENTATKTQGGIGFELIVIKGGGLKLFGEYNYLLNDELDGHTEGEMDDVLLRMGLGLHIYFGGNKKKEKLRRKMKTVINSNLIIPYN